MSTAWMFKIPLFMASAICNMIFALLFFILRSKAQENITTKSQKWGLSLLGAVFFINALEIAGYVVLLFSTSGGFARIDFSSFPFAYRILLDLMHVNSFVILVFGAVFPRPVFQWSRMKYLVALLFGVSFILVLIRIPFGDVGEIAIIYLASVYLFPVIWLRQCAVERSDLCRKILVLLSWGFLFGPMTQMMQGVPRGIIEGEYPKFDSDVRICLFLFVLSLIAYNLWIRRRKWGSAERLNLAFLGISFICGISIAATMPLTEGMPELGWNLNRINSVGFILVNDSGWMLVRPVLFSLALLRYQLFGTEIRAGVYFRIIGSVFILSILAAFTQIPVLDSDETVRAGVAVASCVIAAYPVWLIVDRGMKRLLPLSGRESQFRMSEKRDTYLISLQTAVVDGAVHDEGDRRALETLRRKLGISDKEHSLMLTFFPKPEKPVETPEVQELFLMKADGRLVAHAGKMGGDKDLFAGMLTAIRGFVAEGLQGGQKELETVKYGEYTLVMESEGEMVLATLVLGPDSPDVRVLLRDTLTESFRLRGEELKHWDGTLEKLKGLPEMLSGTIQRSNPSKTD